jgi:hypothetical protein
MAGRLFNLAKMNTETTGTGTITLTTAAAGFLSFAHSGVSNGEVVTYIIEEGANRELGYGTYSTSGITLTRNVLKSTNSDSAISLSGTATVGITAARENFLEWFANIDANGFNLGMDDNTGINDDSGNETIRFRKTSSAVNYLEVLNTETTVGPLIAAAGDDTNIDLRLAAKGTGRVQIPNATLTTPALGTPASGTLTNCTGLPVAGGGTGASTAAGARTNLSVREAITAARTYFVRTTGNDSNDGLASGTAFLTIAKAVVVIQTIDFNGYPVTIDIGAGTWAERIIVPRCVGQSGVANLVFNGAGATTIISPSTSAFAPSVQVAGAGVSATFQNMKIENLSTNGVGLTSSGGASTHLGASIEIGVTAFAALRAVGGEIYINSALSFSGNTATALQVSAFGYIGVGAVIAFGTRTFTTTASASGLGIMEFYGGAPTGTVTATRYAVTTNAYINTFGGGVSYIPGNVAGTPNTGGLYA